MAKKNNGRAAAPVQVEVKPIGPMVVTTNGAAIAINRSITWLRQMRVLDTRRLEQGLEPVGPRWCTLGQSVLYRVDDLQQWVNRATKPFGHVGFRGSIRHEEGQP